MIIKNNEQTGKDKTANHISGPQVVLSLVANNY